MLTVYQTDDHCLLQGGARQEQAKSHRQVLVAPPAIAAGHVARWVTGLHPVANTKTFGDAGTGAWEAIEDHRKDTLWVERGKPYTIGSDHEGQAYDGLGPVPAWLHTDEPAAPPPTLEQLRQAMLDAATDKRWTVMTGGIVLTGGIEIGTAIDDQNRITSVVANAALAGLTDADEVDFKAVSGWARVSIGTIKQFAGAIGQFVQDCYTAERAHHDAIAVLDDYEDLSDYDVDSGWPSRSQA